MDSHDLGLRCSLPPAAAAHARAILDAAATGAHTPTLNGHELEPATLREAERVLAIAARPARS